MILSIPKLVEWAPYWYKMDIKAELYIFSDAAVKQQTYETCQRA